MASASTQRTVRYLPQLLLLFFFYLPLQALAQEGVSTDTLTKHNLPVVDSLKNAENPFFTDEQVLRFKLRVNFQELLKDRGEEREYHEGTLSYQDTSGAEVSLNLKVMVRGNRRRDPLVCRFPPLMLNFSRKTVQSTVFGNVNKLKLVTHCSGEEYILREYLVYKLYNTMTNQSFRVRLCQVDYEDIQGKRKPERKYAFLIEDDDDMAARTKGVIVPKELVVRMEGTNELAMAKVALFQYMIGNTDWSVPFRHNIKLLSTDSRSRPIPVPYDFDYAGIVSSPYAVPPPELSISSVRQRLYRGCSFPDAVYQEAVHSFNTHKADFYNLYKQSNLVDEKYKKQTLKFLDDFYKTINTPKLFHNSIVRVGQQNMKGAVVIKGLK